jgi:membrane protein
VTEVLGNRRRGRSGVLARHGAGVLARWEATFPLRCAHTFLALQGLDRATAIAAQAFTALIPLLLLVSALAPSDRRDLVSEAMIDRFGLAGGAAEAVDQLFARPGESSIGILSVLLVLISGVSFTRRLQRMYLQTWRLEPVRGPRGSLDAAVGLTVLVLEIALLSLASRLVDALPFGGWVLGGPVTFLASLAVWTSVPWLLLGRRIAWRRLLPAGALTALATGAYGVATTIYMPSVMEQYSERYGLFGVTIALVGWLLAIAVILVGATVVAAEFDRAPEAWARALRKRLALESARAPTDVPEHSGG